MGRKLTKINPNIPKIRKREEFDAFVKTLKDGTSAHWLNIAEAIGVDKDTITAWKQLPEARKAIREGIRKNIKKMEEAGSGDWKMWESKLKMLGISSIEKHQFSGEVKTALVRFYGEEAKKINE